MNINDILQKKGFDPKVDKLQTKTIETMLGEINILIRRMKTPEMIALKKVDEYSCMMTLEDEYPNIAPSLIRNAVRGFTPEVLKEISKMFVKIDEAQKKKASFEKIDSEYKESLDKTFITPLVQKLEEDKKK